MGWSKVWKAIKNPFKKSSKVRIISSGLVGGAIGLVTGGVPGAIAGAVLCTSVSIENGGSFVVGATIPINAPKKRDDYSIGTGSFTNTSVAEEEFIIHETIESTNEEIPSIEPEKGAIQAWLENAKENNTVGWKIITWVGDVLKFGEDIQNRLDSIEGPRFIIEPDDSQELVTLKIQANRLVTDIENNCGNYDHFHKPVTDIIMGRELCNTVSEIQRLELLKHAPKPLPCPICGGSGSIINNDNESSSCINCGGSGEIMGG